MSIYSTITKNQTSGVVQDPPSIQFKGSDIEEYFSDHEDVEDNKDKPTSPDARSR